MQNDPGILARLNRWACALKLEAFALYLAARDSRTPWYAKVVTAAVAAYALSPIDLIPDFVPVIGYLDDLIIVPAGIALAVRLIPQQVMHDCRREAQARTANSRPRSMAAAGFIIFVWLAVSLGVVLLVWHLKARDGHARQ